MPVERRVALLLLQLQHLHPPHRLVNLAGKRLCIERERLRVLLGVLEDEGQTHCDGDLLDNALADVQDWLG